MRRIQRELLLNAPLLRQAGAELLGTCLLVAVVIGSGIMAERLSDDIGVQLLAGTIATTLGLATLIVVLQPISGAHLNPVVTLVDHALGRRRAPDVLSAFVLAQCVGAIGGAVLANAMFSIPTSIATHSRADAPTMLGEAVATAGLVFVIFALVRAGRAHLVAPAAAAWIGAAYWATSSTAFANPAVTIGRMFSDTFAGIAPASTLWYIGAQLVGGTVALGLVKLLVPHATTRAAPGTAADRAAAASDAPTTSVPSPQAPQPSQQLETI